MDARQCLDAAIASLAMAEASRKNADVLVRAKAEKLAATDFRALTDADTDGWRLAQAILHAREKVLYAAIETVLLAQSVVMTAPERRASPRFRLLQPGGGGEL